MKSLECSTKGSCLEKSLVDLEKEESLCDLHPGGRPSSFSMFFLSFLTRRS